MSAVVEKHVARADRPAKTIRTELVDIEDYMPIGRRLRDMVTWHHDRNLIEGSDDKTQFAKLIQEVGELSDNLCKGKDIRDDVGDIVVVLVNLCARNRISFLSCLDQAWNDIKDRQGIMYEGVFIKSTDTRYAELVAARK
ncbi:MazG-like family protein [Pseudomonas brenneri]|uniref:MazG-like family protein n=1 Tax=Pseudomonas brenneri TaxID=129817 RepID=UPI0025A27515|nr:MazG-like family protein [Pseudomonas brenneri]WJM94057.1 MazG-like family protein [Pseudomonas brenneri]